jgi:hypothetical protein
VRRRKPVQSRGAAIAGGISMTRRRKVTFVACAAVTILCLAWNRESLFFRTAQYEGDGTFVHHGAYGPLPAWYEVLFPEVPLDRPGFYHFRCRGLPPKAFTFELRVKLRQPNWGAWTPYDDLRDLNTQASIKISDADGTVLRAVSDPFRERARGLGQSPALDGWTLRAAEREYGELVFHHWKCVAVPVHTNQIYHIDFALNDIDPDTPHLTAVPSLRCSSK